MKTDFLHEAIRAAEAAGADYADIYIQCGEGHSIHFEDGKTDEISSSTADGSGSRVIVGGQTFYSHAPGITAEAVGSCFAETVRDALKTRIKVPTERFDIPLLETGAAAAQPSADFFRAMDSQLKKESSEIRQSSYRYTTTRKKVLIIGPEGRLTEESRWYTSFSAQVIVERKGMLQTGSERRCLSLAAENFWDGSAPLEVARTALRRALLMLEAKNCPAGKMNVIIAGEAGGTIVHEACGHGLEADIVEKDHSVYRNKIGERVAHESITMLDDATLPGLYGSYQYDDEGNPAAKTVLIEKGILKAYMTDELSSRLYGLPITGNGRRESYRHIPVPRMSNTFVLPGTESLDSMLAKAEKGLFVKKMGGGEVDPTSGDFVFYVSEGYLIENSKIGTPVRGAILTGNGPEALRNISALGTKLLMDPGICGKSGQGVPVTDGQPTMLIEGLTVGGSEA